MVCAGGGAPSTLQHNDQSNLGRSAATPSRKLVVSDVSSRKLHGSSQCGPALLPLAHVCPPRQPSATRSWRTLKAPSPQRQQALPRCTTASIRDTLQQADGASNASLAPHWPPGKLLSTAGLGDYVERHTREPEVLRQLREETCRTRGGQMLVTVEQGAFLGFLVGLIQAKKCVEVGVFTGYSAIYTALSMPEQGKLLALDRDLAAMEIAKKYFDLAGVQHKVHPRLGDALESLHGLLKDPNEHNSFDFAFVDADKKRYPEYYEAVLQLVRPGGLIVFDNVLWKGKVALADDKDKRTVSMQRFNKALLEDGRIVFSLVTLGDGMALCRKKHI